MKLIETVDLMNSKDYKDRFKAEYLQLEIRVRGLADMLEKYKAGTLPFEPVCSYDLLSKQLSSMIMYKTYLEERASIEKIEL